MSKIERAQKIEELKERYYHTTSNEKTSNGRFKKILEAVADESGNTGSVTGTTKLLSSALKLFEEIATDVDTSTVRDGLGFFANIIKIASIAKTAHEIGLNRKDKLKLASLILGSGTAALHVFKVLDYFKIITLSNLATHLGKIPTIGLQAAKWIPFGNIISVLEIINSSIDIAIASKKIKKLKKDNKHCDDKRKFWAKIQKRGYVRREVVHSKVEKMNEKLENRYRVEKESFKWMYKNRFNRLNQAEEKLEAVENSQKLHFKKLRIKLAKRRIVKAEKRFLHSEVLYQKAKKATKAYEAKIENWKALGQTDRIKDEGVSLTASRKIEKWNIKEKINNKEVRTQGRSIALNTTLIVLLIAAIVLGGLALTGLPFVGIPLALGFLSFSIMGLGFSLWKKYRKKPTYASVPLPSAA